MTDGAGRGVVEEAVEGCNRAASDVGRDRQCALPVVEGGRVRVGAGTASTTAHAPICSQISAWVNA